jgi:hypothetical protein
VSPLSLSRDKRLIPGIVPPDVSLILLGEKKNMEKEKKRDTS